MRTLAFSTAVALVSGLATAAPTFTMPPGAAAHADGVRIEFAASEATDVAVEILDNKGAVVRHLAAGMLGPHAPEPLARDSLKQSLVWDRKDDDGRPVAGPCKARVGLGLQATYAGEFGGGCKPSPLLPWDGTNIDGLNAIACGPDGTLYMLGGFFHPHLDRFPHLIAIDQAGKYLHEVYPPPASLLAGKTPGLPTLKLADGSLVPQVQTWWDLFIPQMTTTRNMAATPDGHLLLGTVAPDYVKERRALLKLRTDGSVPSDAFALRLPPGMHTPRLSMATSPDCKLLYVSGMATTRPKTPLHAVYQLALDGSNSYSLFYGEEKVAGEDDKHLRDPAGVDVDRDGNVHVADHGNSRVMVIRPDGTLLSQFKADRPFAVRVNPATKAVYVLTVDMIKVGDMVPVHKRLTKFSPQGQELASVDVSVKGHFGYGQIAMRYGGLALSTKGDRATLWIGCTSAPDGCNGYPLGYSHGLVKVVDDGKGLSKAEFVDMAAAVFDARRKEWAAREQKEIQRDGHVYKYTMRSSGDPSVINLRRYDAKGKEAPFPAAGEQKWVPMLGRPSSRYFGRALVNRQGDILFSYYNWLGNDAQKKYGATCVDLLAPDGTVRKRELVYGMHEGTFSSSLLVDRKGCVYVADHVQPPSRLAPEEIEAAFAAAGKPVGSTYVATYGSVLKFAPSGGGLKWGAIAAQPPPKGDLIRRPMTVQDKAGEGKPRTASCQGIEWQFFGAAPVPATRGICMCTGTGFALDAHARVFIPDAYRMCVHVLDANGNHLLRIGRYGNQDDAKGRIAFARPRAVTVDGCQITVIDPQNGKGTRIDLTSRCEETVALP